MLRNNLEIIFLTNENNFFRFYFRYKDAVFMSPHKFVGGPGSPGILVAKKSLFTNAVPHGAGGGTVLYVSDHLL